jgi:magnesium transporter
MPKYKEKKLARKKGGSNNRQKVGLSPGSLIHIGKVKTDKPVIDLIEYNNEQIIEKKDIGVQQAKSHLNTPLTTWIKVTGLHNTQMIGELGEAFGLHPLLLEDILNTAQRPKLDMVNQAIFMSMKVLYKPSPEDDISADQVSFVLRNNVLISFHESELPLFDPLKIRLQNTSGRLRTKGPDYLFFALVDIAVDNYFEVVENSAELIDNIEDHLFEASNDDVLLRIQRVKRELLFLKKNIFPLREALMSLIKTDSGLIKDDNQKYFMDVHDHIMQISDSIESSRELNSSLKDAYMSIISNKMNQVMKTLTIIATIFIPLTFVAGIYGMNFEYMPELSWKYGYFAVWGVMAGISVIMLMVFKKRKWL